MATVHGVDITIVGKRPTVELLIKILGKRYESKKQVIGEAPDLEQSGRTLNRVIEWGRDDGITIEADQRHVREIFKALDMERASHTATPWSMERKRVGSPRSEECNWERRCEQGRTEAQYERDVESTRDDGYRVQMAGDDETDSQTLAGVDITIFWALVSRISYLSQDRPDLKFASMQPCCAKASPTVRDWERFQRIGWYLAARPRAKGHFHG